MSKNPNNYVGVIDIGSNSVRLVVFSGFHRVPEIIFNEKTLCGLGADVGTTGNMGKASMKLAMSTLKRFKALCHQMEVKEVYALATAALRDAKNGPAFKKKVEQECGLPIEIISGEAEGRLSALGVISGEPTATGIVGDLGGGSLELVRVAEGQVHEKISLPIGPLRLTAKHGRSTRILKKELRSIFSAIDWLQENGGNNLYLVGGAWRNISKLMMRERAAPLPILHGFETSQKEMSDYCRRISGVRPEDLPFGQMLSARRRDVLPMAALILKELISITKPKSVILSSYGLREGFLFDHLSKPKKKLDPFLYTCRELAEERCRFVEHADLLFDWTRPIFETHKVKNIKRQHRLHTAICLLADIAWRGHPDFRAERAVETILHGNFFGVSHADRSYIGVALNDVYGAPIDQQLIAKVLPLLTVGDMQEARMMGAAIRLAQRLSGGAKVALEASSLIVTKSKLILKISTAQRDIANEVVEKRLSNLAQLIGRKPLIQVGSVSLAHMEEYS
ncbi:Ppx/GppA family phosphatase [Kordiimonas sediminis]|uniref:Ppx/GppA family phosphatase n=1 Tax=Kordiimonas sediminis TaxID=1735581 RepID=UPI00174DF9F9|nr:Ppx/GppA family phosphatase [Kordiimonas sediminis]